MTIVITDQMAYAFHAALSDSALGTRELDVIKAGLRAALAAVEPLASDDIALEIHRYANQTIRVFALRDNESKIVEIGTMFPDTARFTIVGLNQALAVTPCP